MVMEKKMMKVLGCLLLLGVVAAGGVWWYSQTSNPWNAYGCCSTFSVSRETEPRKISEVQPGDVLVYPARKLEGMGHALIVVDVARRGKKVAIMCAEGNTPAREAHIVRNLNPLENPWFFFDGNESTLWVSVFHFGKNELRHY